MTPTGDLVTVVHSLVSSSDKFSPIAHYVSPMQTYLSAWAFGLSRMSACSAIQDMRERPASIILQLRIQVVTQDCHMVTRIHPDEAYLCIYI